jgi:hypothetical protein
MALPQIRGDAEGLGALVSGLGFWAFLIFLSWRFIRMRGVRGEMFRAVKDGAVQMSGSRFKPKAPMAITIEKQKVGTSEQEDSS